MTSFYDDATVEHVAKHLNEVEVELDGAREWDGAPPWVRANYRHHARAALDALATAPGWRVEYRDTGIAQAAPNARGAVWAAIPSQNRLVGPWVEAGGDDR